MVQYKLKVEAFQNDLRRPNTQVIDNEQPAHAEPFEHRNTMVSQYSNPLITSICRSNNFQSIINPSQVEEEKVE
jgi:hypothetical protein